MSNPGATPPTPDQLRRRAMFRDWAERNKHLVKPKPETPTQATGHELQIIKKEGL